MKLLIIRLASMIFGLALFALAVIITLKANIGYAPWEVLHVGLSNTTGMSIGTATILVGLVLLVIVTISGEKLGLGSVANMLLVGIFMDIILRIDFIPIAPNMPVGIAMLFLGMFTLSFASFFYIKAAFGAGPRDNLMVVLARKTRMPVGICRGITELLATVIGWLLGGMIGVGTIITIIGIGFCIQFTFWVLKFDVTAVKHESLKDTFTALTVKKQNAQKNDAPA